MMPMSELVMPAGTLEKLQFACAYGADAVYAGMPKFSLRARTNSFTEADLAEGIRYAHERGVKVYLTLNIFARNRRIEEALAALRALLPLQPDAVILSDPGLVMLIRREHPGLELHLSTQANTMNWAAAQFWQAQGIRRVILPRELSIPEIAEIHARAPEIELEAFAHGAMCVAYSGRCLLSSYLTHRDANLGVCANACRWQYRLREERGAYALEEAERPGEFFPIEEDEHGAYILNSKDLCAIEYLRQLDEAGVTAFKIEGRTKSVYYLAHVGRAYRRGIDAMRRGQPPDAQTFEDIAATASREMMPGFLIDLPDEARQNYARGFSAYSKYQFGGVAREYLSEKRLVKVDVRNRLAVGMMLEFISPEGDVRQELRAMFALDGSPITEAHGGGTRVLIAVEQAIPPFALLRLALKNDGS